MLEFGLQRHLLICFHRKSPPKFELLLRIESKTQNKVRDWNQDRIRDVSLKEQFQRSEEERLDYFEFLSAFIWLEPTT
jgi:hypothetical protein